MIRNELFAAEHLLRELRPIRKLAEPGVVFETHVLEIDFFIRSGDMSAAFDYVGDLIAQTKSRSGSGTSCPASYSTALYHAVGLVLVRDVLLTMWCSRRHRPPHPSADAESPDLGQSGEIGEGFQYRVARCECCAARDDLAGYVERYRDVVYNSYRFGGV